ncbi:MULTISPECIES: GNAT family N-acetyltransferase [Stenotrophomonas]|jgi:GNAT superfamily N-acetyltransferase|uniref:GNAT family N-acetyltransferase n=1 Tax=Stenotrophomonas muris TaxID=2963283 RepID=A0ABU5MHY5_9GAMM|nr:MULTISPECIES: GNAT family N-acetyltransferase [Stenotrophomonas]KDE91071.1 acetyltransferase [Stenotrophomonas maltophilia M30]KOQ63015.1 acetyltransferase [Stenotrophomonas maltophilia]KUO98697.1 acetyltransferase [Stenotrophomonas maltophilia]MBA0455023.1 GNAT family N-acetyltransferase [Stenotrophomonas maltophilia]MBH1359030.1 GNAT family N-acetyltransferase [Stenotrophomonas maltophilia]
MVPPDPSSTMLHIREAMPADVSALIALDSVAVHDPQRARQISDWQARGGMHVAEWAGQLAGYLVIHHHFFGEAFVEMLMVAREQRSQGVGAALLRHAIALHGHGRLFTSTNASNTGMQRLLAASGFIDSGIVHGLDEGDPELLYRFAGS